jgi:hypothetical protein
MESIYYNLGVWAAICAACLALAIVQSLLFLAIGLLGMRIWKRITHVYALHVIQYWLKRLEKEGTHCFEKAAKEPQ